MDFETCYAYKPVSQRDSRPNKKRRVESTGLHASWPSRRSIYRQLWSIQEQRLKDLQSEINEKTIGQISTFIQDAHQDALSIKVPSALILTGPSIASHALLFEQLSAVTVRSPDNIFVALTSSLAPNLKTLLKHLIQKAIQSVSNVDAEDDEEVARPNRKRPRLLNYDLRLLHEHVQERNISRVVVAFQDCEAYDGPLLSDVIDLLSCWKDRIPFVFLFGVATSIPDFQAKLSKKATRCIDGRRFDVVKADTALEQAFETIHSNSAKVWIGAGLCDTILRRQRDHVQSLDVLQDSVHYAYLSHFYANALTVLLDGEVSVAQISADHFTAVRHLPSFQAHVESLLGDRHTTQARSLLDSNDDLFRYVKEHIATGVRTLQTLTQAVDVLHALQQAFPSSQQIPRSSLIVDALGGQLHESPWERTLLLRLRKCNSEAFHEVLKQLLNVMGGEMLERCKISLSELEQLLQENTDGPLRSEEDLQNATLRTTVVAKKVELSKQKSAMTKADAAYSSLLRQFKIDFEDYLVEALIDPKELVFNEIFVYDLKSPHRDVFMPKPRFAVERAMASPHDYLDCDCCSPEQGGDENTLSSTQPATAILYQLYLESGALINASDLRTAFFAIINGGDEDEDRAAALFQRSLAELRYLGLVKGTRKKTDHIMKMSWRGL